MAPLLNEEKDVYRLNILHKIWEAYCEMQKRLNNMFAYLVTLLLCRIGLIISKMIKFKILAELPPTLSRGHSLAKLRLLNIQLFTSSK